MAQPPPVMVQPGVQTTVIMQQSTQVYRDWTSGLFGCFDDIASCLCGLFCGPCLLCQISQRMGEGCVYGWCCYQLAPYTLRAKLRAEQNIQGSLCNDALTIMCCGPCMLCQMSRELTKLGR